MTKILRKSLPYICLAVVGLVVFLHSVGHAQPPGGNNRGGNPGGPGGGFPGAGGGNQPGRGGVPGGMTPGAAVGNQLGRGGPGAGVPGGFPGGGGFPGAPANLATRGGAPGAGFPGGGGFPGAPANLATRGGAPGAGFPGLPGGGFPSAGGFPAGVAFPAGGMMNFGGAMPVAAAQQPRQQNNNSGTGTATLVPEFGERQAETPRVLRFGDYAETTSATTTGRNSGNANSVDADVQRRINDQAQQLMNRFDRDRNGMIERSTGEWNNLSFDASLVDTNRDGRITLDELRVYVGKQVRGGGTSGAKIFTSYGATYEHMPDGIPAWFTERDKDNDGQLTLFEYANGQPITAEIVAEFEWLDLNNDGIATLAECYSAIKTKEEQERKALEEQGIVAGGNTRNANQPRGNTPAAPARGTNNNTSGGTFVPSADQAANRNTQQVRPSGTPANVNANNNQRANNAQPNARPGGPGVAGAGGRGAGGGPGGGGFGGGAGAGRGGRGGG